MFGSMFGMDASDMTDMVLDDIVRNRRDYLDLCQILLKAYRSTFSHEAIEPLTERDKYVRQALEEIFWEGIQEHRKHHSGRCSCSDDSTYEQFCKAYREAAFRGAVAEWEEMVIDNDVQWPEDQVD